MARLSHATRAGTRPGIGAKEGHGAFLGASA